MKDTSAWYVLIGSQKYGPYKYKKILHMLQSNQLMDFNYVWAEHLQDWTPIYQLEEFSKEHFDYLLKKEPEYVSTFIERQHRRITVNIPVIGHNSLKFFDGELVSLSEGGALCRLSSVNIEVGEQIKLQLRAEAIFGRNFNLECVVLRKNYSKQRLLADSGLYYAVKFHEIGSDGLEQIRLWVKEAA